jgi:hypothetical protein
MIADDLWARAATTERRLGSGHPSGRGLLHRLVGKTSDTHERLLYVALQLRPSLEIAARHLRTETIGADVTR